MYSLRRTKQARRRTSDLMFGIEDYKRQSEGILTTIALLAHAAMAQKKVVYVLRGGSRVCNGHVA